MAAVSDVDLRTVDDAAMLTQIRDGMDQYGVLVFKNQQFNGTEQIAFAKCSTAKFTRKRVRVLGANRFGNEALTDISNVGNDGEVMDKADRKRLYGLANRLWHIDASFENHAPLLDADGICDPSGRGRHGICGHPHGLRHAAGVDEKAT